MPAPAKPMTLTQKILAHHAKGLSRPWVQSGDIVRIKVDWTIASELAWNGMDRTYSLLGRPKIHDKERFYLAVDHTVDPKTLAEDARTQKLVQLSRSFAKESGIRHFYDANQTILHTKFYRDLVQPGDVVLGADSHTSSHGGLSAFSIGLGGADIAVAMVLGESWIEVPEAIAVEYQGKLPFGIGGKDVILKTLGALGRNTVAMERSVEYRGDVADFTTDMRFTIANMTAEFGGLNGIFEADEQTRRWLATRRDHNKEALYFRADANAPYVERFPIRLENLAPQVAKPFSPDNVKSIDEAKGEKLHGAFIGACTTTEEELVLAALVLEAAMKDGRTPVKNEKRIVVPGDLSILENLKKSGLISIYEKAGFRVDPPGCSMCLGVASVRADKGETWLSSQNRNFPNRMGEGSFAWLASAATVAASSLEMSIADPRPLLGKVDREKFSKILARPATAAAPEIRATEPAPALSGEGKSASAGGEGGSKAASVVRGKVQKFGDNIDTDAIIPGEFCHLTKLEELGDHCFHHVRPGFAERARKQGKTIVVAGPGWGSGSSREQAVLALKGAGIQLVIAKSYAFIHKRNLVNEAVPYLQVADDSFYALADEDSELEVDLAKGTVKHVASGRTFAAKAPTPMVRALQREGGLVPAIQHHGPKVFEVLV